MESVHGGQHDGAGHIRRAAYALVGWLWALLALAETPAVLLWEGAVVRTASVGWVPVDPLRFVLQYQHATMAGGDESRRFQAVALRAHLRF